MSSHNDHDNHSTEPKPVSFRTPLILGLVTILIILLAVSTCDKKQDCCQKGEKCEAACDSKHDMHDATKSHGDEEGHVNPSEAEQTTH